MIAIGALSADKPRQVRAAHLADPRPTIGDSVATKGGSTPQVVIAAAGEQTEDIDLNFVLFFTP